jgi:3-hydroxyacyl-CoA dehydrogenase
MMHHAKQEVVKQHTAWIQIVVARVDRFKEIVKTMTKFSQVEDFAKQFGWVIAPEILADKIGMDLVISIDDAVDSIMNIGKKAPSREEKIKARILYNAQQSSLAS